MQINLVFICFFTNFAPKYKNIVLTHKNERLWQNL